MTKSPGASGPTQTSSTARLLRFFHPSHQHSAFSATVLLMTAIMMSRVIGYIREAYIAYAFGAGAQTDAYVAAFTLPDWLNYIVAGGTASITFVSIYTRFLAQKREEEARKTFSIIITVMTTVLLIGTCLAEIFTPQFERWMFHGFTPQQLQLCVHLTRILLPAQIFFYVGGVISAVLLSHRLFLFPAFGPLIYNVFIILGGMVMGKHLGIASLAYGALLGSFVGPFLVNAIGAARVGIGYRPSFDVRNPSFREWVRLSIPLMVGVSLITADDWILRYFASNGVYRPLKLCQTAVCSSHRSPRASYWSGFPSLFCAFVRREAHTGIRHYGERVSLPGCCRLISLQCLDDGRRTADH
ncbi:MAG: hypothetical protein DMG73_07495 [Acidobacteria bacterium]|nr:MAG: hypothetical protein DMG73_07495 [Acidobacteriota bacterium]